MDEGASQGSAEKHTSNPYIGEQSKWCDHFVQEGAEMQRQENAPQWSDWTNGRLDRHSEGKPVGRVLRLGLGVRHVVDGCALSAASSSRSAEGLMLRDRTPAAQVLTPQVRLTSAVLAELFGRQEIRPDRGACDERWDRTKFGEYTKRNDSSAGEKCMQREVEKSASLRGTVAWINSQIAVEERADDIKNNGEMDAAQICEFTKVTSLLYAAVKQVCPGMRTVRRWTRKRAHLTSLCKPVSTQSTLSTAIEAHCETSRLNSYQPAQISVLLHQQQDTLEANCNLSSQAKTHLWKAGFALTQHHQTGSTVFFASHSATNSCTLAHIKGILGNRYSGTATAPRAVGRDQVLVMATQIPEGLTERLKRADRGDKQKQLVTACDEATEIAGSEIGTVDASEKTNFGTIPPRDWQTNRNADREDTVQTGWSGLGYETGPAVSQSAGAITAAAAVRKNEGRHPKDEPQKDDCSSNGGASLVVNVRVRVAIDDCACKGKGNYKAKRHINVRGGGGTTKDGRLKAGPHEAPDAGGWGKARDGNPHQEGGVAKTQTIKPETRIGFGNSGTSRQSSHLSEEDLTGVKVEQKRGKAEKNMNTKSQKNNPMMLPNPGQASDDLHFAPESGLYKNKLGSTGSQEGSSEVKEGYNGRRSRSSGSTGKADAETLYKEGEEVVIADERGGGWKETTRGTTFPENGPVKTANQKEISDGLNIATEGGPHKPGSEAPQRKEGSPEEMQVYKTGSKKSSTSVNKDSEKSTDARRSSDDINGTAQSGPRNTGSYERRELSDSSPEDQVSKKGKSRRSEVTAPVAVADRDDLLKERELSGVEHEQGRGNEGMNENSKFTKNGLVTSADPNRSTSGVNFTIQDREQVNAPEDTEGITGSKDKATNGGGLADTAAVTSIPENRQVEGNLEGTEDDQNGGGEKRNESTRFRKGGSVASADPNRPSAGQHITQSGPHETIRRENEKGGIGRPATTTAAKVNITNADGQCEEGQLVRVEDEQSRGVSAGNKSSGFRQNESAISPAGGQSSKDPHVLTQSEQQEATLGDRGQKNGPEETEVYKSQGTKSAGPTDLTVVTVIEENSYVEGKPEEIKDGPRRGNEATGESTGPVVPENLNLLSDGLGIVTQDGPHETALDLPRRGEDGLESTEGREGGKTRMSGPATIPTAKATTANSDALYGEGELVSVEYEQGVEERAENRTSRPLKNGSVTFNDPYALAQSGLQEATPGDDKGQTGSPEGTGVHGSKEAKIGGSADAVMIENSHKEGKPGGIKDEQNRREETGSANAGPRKSGSVLSADLNHWIGGPHVTTQNGLHETGFDLPRRAEEELEEAEGRKSQKGGTSGSVVVAAAIASDTRKSGAVHLTNDLSENGGGGVEGEKEQDIKTASAIRSLEEGGPGGSFGQVPTTWEMVQTVTIDDTTNLPDELTLESETEKFIRKLANQSTATRCRRLGDTNVLLDRLIMDTARSIRRGVRAVGRKGG
ncbi:hypothetical protein SprV_0602087100 [Sparganum proliferum]